MVWLSEWTAFQSQAQAMFIANPSRTRLNVNYRHVDNELVVRISDGVSTLCFKTGEAGELKLVDRFIQWLSTEATGESAPVGTKLPAVERKNRKVERERKRADRGSKTLEKRTGNTLAQVRHKQKVSKKRALKWERRQDRKMVAASTTTSKPAAAGAGAK